MAKGSEAHDEMDEILNDLLQEPDPEEVEDEGNPNLEAVEEAKPEPEPEEDHAEAEEEEPEEEEPEPVAAETEASETPEVVEESPEDKRAAGLLREVQDLRRKLAEQKAQANAVQPPPPVIQPPAPTETTAKGVPVILSEDGQSLYADPEALRAENERIVRELIEAEKQPDPQQVKIYENQRVMQEFVQADPDRHRPVVERAGQADDYLTLQFESLRSQGYQINTTTELVSTMRQLGIDQQVAEFFPEIAPMLDEFVEGMASGNPTWRRSLLTRMAGSAPEGNGQNSSPIKPITGSPTSMARKGGSRSQSPSSDDAEFNSLQSNFRKDVLTFPEDKYKRMHQLGKKLGKPGFE